jgi:hypothetical protein
MKNLICFILLLLFLQSPSVSQTVLEGTFSLTSQQDRQDYIDEYTFSDDGFFKYSHLMYKANECGIGVYTISDTVLTLTFSAVSLNIKDSLRSHYIVSESKVTKGDTAEFIISVLDHNDMPVLGASAQLVDENEFNIVDKVKKYWDVDSDGNVTVSFEKNLELFGIKIANRGYETLIIPVNKDTNKIITVKLLELEKCSHVIEAGTVKIFYLKNVRFSGFYMREEGSPDYLYYKSEK